MKARTVNPKELVAWIVLAFAFILFGVSFALAQDKKKKEKDDGKIHINIIKDENGKKVKIDTTIAEKDLPALKEYLKEKDIDFDFGPGMHSGRLKIYKGDGDDDDVVMNLNGHDLMSKEDRAKFKKDMKKMHEDLGKMKDEMKEMHIEMFRDGEDGEDSDFDFHMMIPPSIPGHSYNYSFNNDGDKDAEGNFKVRSFNFFDNDIPDSLRDDEHFVLKGKEGEEKPELEKEITGKNGEKIWVFKRKLPASAELTRRKGEGLLVSRLKVYPNPSDGKISVSFRAASKGDVKINITDSNGKEVYNQSLKDFEGEYFQQVDISGKGKGSYYLKIISGDDTLTKKILVE